MAMTYGDATYANKLKQMVTDPASYQGSTGFNFALNTGLDALKRSNSRMRGSGNALTALTQYGTGLAQQDYGNEVDRLGRLTGQEQNYDVAQTGNANTLTLGNAANANNATRNANDLRLGLGANANAAQRNQYDYTLGSEANRNTAQRNAWDYSLGQGANANTAARTAADYELGSRGLDNTAQRNWWDYNLGSRGLDSADARAQNDFNLNNSRGAIDWYNAGTNRGSALSTDYYRGQQNQREWMPFNPPRRIV